MTVKVGHVHNWRYQSRWREKKVRPGLWRFNVSQTKERIGRQYRAIEGAPVGTVFTWGIQGIQKLWKVSPNKYKGYFKGRKRFIRRR